MPNKTWEDAPGTLPKQGRKVWAAAFNSAWSGTCADEGERRDECASRVAWGAVKRDYEQKDEKWVKKSSSEELDLVGLSRIEPTGHMDFIIAKASSSAGKMRWVARASDTLKDDLDTQMTTELFNSFLLHQEIVGLPYISIAHFGALGGKGIAGTTESMWIDGIAFKAKGEFADTSLGRALFGAILQERNDPSTDPEGLIRLSIGFVDLSHNHGEYLFQRQSLDDPCPICLMGQLPTQYVDGVLVHLAATRVPINRRTNIYAEDSVTMRGGKILTRRGDAASIIGEELAEQLQQLTDEGFGDEVGQERALVVKAKGEEQAVQPATEIELLAQQARSRRYGIEVRSDGNASIPADLKRLGIGFADFGDPVNCRFPVWMTVSKKSLTSTQLGQMRSSAADLVQEKASYGSKSRARISERVQRALVKFAEKTERGGSLAYGPPLEPVGGATSYREAKAWMDTQEASAEFYDQVGVMEAVMGNILQADTETVSNRKSALRSAMEEFMDDFDNLDLEPDTDNEGEDQPMVENSAVVTEPTVLPVVIPEVIPVVVPPVEVAPPPVVQPIELPVVTLSAAVKPVVDAIRAFETGIVGVFDESVGTSAERLQKIQPMLETMSNAIVEASDKVPGETETDLVLALRSALAAEFGPLNQTLQLLLGRMADGGAQSPVRRTMSHVLTPVVPSDPQMVSSFSSIARGSVGIPGKQPGS